MSAINRVVLTGNLTADPESIADGKGVRLGVAVNERIKKGDEWQDYVSFFDVSVWGKQADNCREYLSKGSKIAVDGKLRQRRWETDSGGKRSAVGVIADWVVFLTPKSEDGSGGSSGSGSSGADDDIPFARPPILDLEARRRDLFVADRWLA